MKITVNDCLKLDAFNGCRVLAGHTNLDRRVRTVSVLDETDLSMGVERNGAKDQIVIITISGRGDKDVAAIARYRGEELYE